MAMNGTIFVIENGTIVSENTSQPEGIMERNVYIMPTWQQVAYSLLFGCMVLVATGGNLIVIWIVLAHKRMRTVTNYFIVNLSLADTMVSTFNVVFNFIFMLDGNWPFGRPYCKVSNFVSIVSVAASVFTLMAICIDRYMAIMRPLRPRMSRAMTLNIAVFIWLASSTLALPNAIYSTTDLEIFKDGDSRTVCVMEWPDGNLTKSTIDHAYNVIIFVVAYVIPLAAMAYTYFRVGRELWGSQSIGECTATQLESINSKRKVVKMMIVVVAIFAICWLPYHVYFLVAYHHPDIISSKYIQHIYLVLYWLAMSNSMYNPIIYCWMNSRFREGFKRVFCFLAFNGSETSRLRKQMTTTR